MEDKSFELLTKMYSEFSEFRKETNQRFDEVKSDIQKISYQVVKLENDLKPKIEIALEGYQAVSEKLTTLEDKILFKPILSSSISPDCFSCIIAFRNVGCETPSISAISSLE